MSTIEFYNQELEKTGLFGVVQNTSGLFDPNEDYGNEYANVYFRINAADYDHFKGFSSEEKRSSFYQSVQEILDAFGVLEDCGFAVEHNEEKCAYLHIHPQNICGVVKKNDIGAIAEAIDNLSCCNVRWVDVYHTVYVITDEEYAEYLETKADVVRKELFSRAKTTRKNKYMPLYWISRDVACLIRLMRLGLNDGVNYGGGQTIDFVCSVAEKMASEGWLISTEINGKKYIRSLNQTEQKRTGKFEENL